MTAKLSTAPGHRGPADEEDIVEIGDNVLCLGIVVMAGIVAAICAWRGNWPS